MSFQELEELERQLQEYTDNGWIRPRQFVARRLQLP